LAATGSVVAIGTAGVVAGRRGDSAWQSAWYVLIAILALILWGLFAGLVSVMFGGTA
jgi:hypothetical protein